MIVGKVADLICSDECSDHHPDNTNYDDDDDFQHDYDYHDSNHPDNRNFGQRSVPSAFSLRRSR